MVTNVLPGPAVVWMTSELCANPLSWLKPVVGPAGPMDVSEKNQASCEEFSRIADTPSPPAQSAQVEWSEYATHSASSAAGPPAAPLMPNGLSLRAVAAGPGEWPRAGTSQASAMPSPAAIPMASPASSRPRPT